jgi:hypothetical protein
MLDPMMTVEDFSELLNSVENNFIHTLEHIREGCLNCKKNKKCRNTLAGEDINSAPGFKKLYEEKEEKKAYLTILYNLYLNKK